VEQGASVLLIGETGSGAVELGRELHDYFGDGNRCAIATYKASTKNLLKAITHGLGLSTVSEGEKPKDLNLEELKEEVLSNADGAVIILPEAQRLPASIRYWLSDCIADGAKVIALAAQNPKKDLFLELLEIEMALPSDDRIRSIMRAECERYGLRLSEAQLAALQPLAGRNPMLARKVIRSEALGIKQEKPQHSQYLDIWPLILVFFCLLGTLKFIGRATGEQSLYLIGGVAIMVGMSLRYAGQIKGARRKLQ
jgi:hypothetical protein